MCGGFGVPKLPKSRVAKCVQQSVSRDCGRVMVATIQLAEYKMVADIGEAGSGAACCPFPPSCTSASSAGCGCPPSCARLLLLLLRRCFSKKKALLLSQQRLRFKIFDLALTTAMVRVIAVTVITAAATITSDVDVVVISAAVTVAVVVRLVNVVLVHGSSTQSHLPEHFVMLRRLQKKLTNAMTMAIAGVIKKVTTARYKEMSPRSHCKCA